jgi:hypothetical protein
MAGVLRAVADGSAARAITLGAWARHRSALGYYRRELGAWPQIAVPRSYNEKMFWRRVFDHNPAFVRFCDKLATKEIFGALTPPLPTFETLWTGDRIEDLPATLYRPDVVVKHNAGCDRNWFFAHRGTDRHALAAACRAWMTTPYGTEQSEWAYGRARSTLLAEQVLEADPHKLVEFKVHLFGGEVFYAEAVMGIKTGKSRSAIFAADGRRLSVTTSVVARDPSRGLPADFALPDTFGAAMDAARQIARGLDYIRVDLAHVAGRLYGLEVTPYPTAGLLTNSDPAVLRRMGEAWDLGDSWFMRHAQPHWRGAYQRLLRRAMGGAGAGAAAPAAGA